MMPLSKQAQAMYEQLLEFMDKHVYPDESVFAKQRTNGEDRWAEPSVFEQLKEKTRAENLWNLFLPDSDYGAGLSNYAYAHLCEIMRLSRVVPAFSTAMHQIRLIWKCWRVNGNPAAAKNWLQPLLGGTIRSCFSMSEPDMASSDATNIGTEIRRDGEQYVINGHKWWATNAITQPYQIAILMGQSDPNAEHHRQQSMILIPLATHGVSDPAADDRIWLPLRQRACSGRQLSPQRSTGFRNRPKPTRTWP